LTFGPTAAIRVGGSDFCDKLGQILATRTLEGRMPRQVLLNGIRNIRTVLNTQNGSQEPPAAETLNAPNPYLAKLTPQGMRKCRRTIDQHQRPHSVKQLSLFSPRGHESLPEIA
jgi:hypothetical protein